MDFFISPCEITSISMADKLSMVAELPDWKLRRVVDSLEESDLLNVQRVARYRTISADHLEVIADELRRLAWLPSGATIGMNAAGSADPPGRIPTPAAG